MIINEGTSVYRTHQRHMLYSMQSFVQTLFQNDENDLLNCTIYNNIIKYLPILAHYFYNFRNFLPHCN